MEKVINSLRKYKLWIILGINLVCAVGVAVYAYYKSTVVLLPQEIKSKSSNGVIEEKVEEIKSEKIDFSAKRAKREREYFMNAQTQPGREVSTSTLEEGTVIKPNPMIEIPEQPSTQAESKPEIKNENAIQAEEKKQEQSQQSDTSPSQSETKPQQPDPNAQQPGTNTQPSETKPQEKPSQGNSNQTQPNP